MKQDIPIKNSLVIPADEIEILLSRSGGAGGQHVNKTETKVTIRWNVKISRALTEEQKNRILQNLAGKLSNEGDLIIHNSSSRSQQQNKELAIKNFVKIIRKALYVPKIRMKTTISQAVKEARLQEKARHSLIKKMRSKKIIDE